MDSCRCRSCEGRGPPDHPEPALCKCGHDLEDHPRQSPDTANSASHNRPRGPCIECGPLCVGYDPQEPEE